MSQVFKEAMSSVGQEKARGFLGERRRQTQNKGRAQLAVPLEPVEELSLEQSRFINLLVAGAGQVALQQPSNNSIAGNVSCYNVHEMP